MIGNFEEHLSDLKSSDDESRVEAAWALSQLEKIPEDSVPLLLPFLDDPNESVRMYILDVLAKTKGSAEVLRAVEKLRQDKCPGIRETAEIAIWSFEHPGKLHPIFVRRKLQLIGCFLVVVLAIVAVVLVAFVSQRTP